MSLRSLVFVIALLPSGARSEEPTFRLATFEVDVTIPIGHRCMGILPTKAQRIDDSLEARGFVLLGADRPVVVVAVDWCEIRNDSYDSWRDRLAKAAGTTRERVLVCSLHQHDAPVVDDGAQRWLDEVGLRGELFDRDFHEACLRRVERALLEGLRSSRTVTHVGVGSARVEKVASSRRVVRPGGQVSFDRYSRSGGDSFHAMAADGAVDPVLRTLAFFDGETPLLAMHAYATHPMSTYGRGRVSADFVGLARRLRARSQPGVRQMYVTGCSGDVTAGKYNDGSDTMRAVLAARLHHAMQQAWTGLARSPLRKVTMRSASLTLPFHDGPEFRREAMVKVLRNESAEEGDRILAAMGLSSLDRVEADRPIDVPCLEVGSASIVLLPGESFVAYQLAAQRLRPDRFVLAIGYGECWPGYVPTERDLDEGFDHGWRWVSRGSEKRTMDALRRSLGAGSTK